MISVPEEFDRLAIRFHQDSLDGIASEGAWIAQALGGLDMRQKRIAKAFLDELLSDRYDDADLQTVWSNSPADFYLGNNRELRQFLTLMRDMLDEADR